MEDEKLTQLFYSLIYSFQMQTWMSLGKIKNPVTDTVERDLNAAQMTIDIIDMIKEKTKNNLTENESKFVEQVLADLKLNFVHESSQEKDTGNAKEETPKEQN